METKPIWHLGGEATKRKFAGTDHFKKIGRQGWLARQKKKAVDKAKNP
jgi:hypothetical protein